MMQKTILVTALISLLFLSISASASSQLTEKSLTIQTNINTSEILNLKNDARKSVFNASINTQGDGIVYISSPLFGKEITLNGNGDSYFMTGDVGFMTKEVIASVDINGTASIRNKVGIGVSTAPILQPYLLDVNGNVTLNDTLYVINAGKVGIGTDSPTQKLDVRGNINVSNDIYIKNATSVAGLLYNHTLVTNATMFGVYGKYWYNMTNVGGNGNISGAGTANYLSKFTAVGTIGNSAVFESGGSVGIGTASPLKNLHIAGDVVVASAGSVPTATQVDFTNYAYGGQAFGVFSGTGWAAYAMGGSGSRKTETTGLGGYNLGGISFHSFDNSSKNLIESLGAAIVAISDDGNENNTGAHLLFYTKPSGGSANIAMTITNNRHVGIGTPDPQGTLHIVDSNSPNLILDPGASSTADPHLRVADQYASTSAGLDLWYDNDVGSVYFDSYFNNSAGDIYFRTKTAGIPVNALFIESAGNIGIGTTSPADALTVIGDVNISGCYQLINGTIIGGSCASSEEYKKNIEEFKINWTKFSSVKPKTFDFKQEEIVIQKNITRYIEEVDKTISRNETIYYNKTYPLDTKGFGFIYEDVVASYPDRAIKDEDGIKRVNYGFDWVLENRRAIQDLKQQIELLEARIAQLEASKI